MQFDILHTCNVYENLFFKNNLILESLTKLHWNFKNFMKILGYLGELVISHF